MHQTLYQRYGKRIFDIVVATICLILCLPILLLIACTIYYEDQGPILFIHSRVGLNQKIFKMYKFRTMVYTDNNTKSDNKRPFLKSIDDKRITHIGKILREYSFDELPQLWNVIKGDMSLVGPRPFIEAELEYIPKQYYKRFSVKPGMTGEWQIIQRKNEVSIDQLFSYDMHYIKNVSFTSDWKILVHTIHTILFHENC